MIVSDALAVMGGWRSVDFAQCYAVHRVAAVRGRARRPTTLRWCIAVAPRRADRGSRPARHATRVDPVVALRADEDVARLTSDTHDPKDSINWSR